MVDVSVIVTVHNSGDYLYDCLQSLKVQTLESIEVVIVNDCSSDSRDQSIIDAFVSSDARFFCIVNHKNLGTGRSRALGVENASGRYIGFLDSDDIALPLTYQKLYEAAVKNNCGVVAANYEKFSDNVDSINIEETPGKECVEVLSGRRFFDIQISRVNRPYYVRIDWWNKIYKKELFIENSITFPPVVRNEGTMSMIMSLLAERVAILNSSLFLTRVRSDSVCRTFKLKNVQDTIASSVHFKRWLEKLGVYDDYRDLYINMFYFIIFNHNLKLMLKVGKEEREQAVQFLVDNIEGSGEVWRDFLRYINLPERAVERLVYASLRNQAAWKILTKIKATDFFSRNEGFSRSFHRLPMGGRPKVSVVTITINLCEANRIDFFERMLESVERQTYGRNNIEHVVIDGESRDGTVEYLGGLADQNRIDRWVSEKDAGIYNAMNKGPLYGSGDYIIYLNSDDCLADDAIEKLVSAVQSSGADYAFGDADKVDESGEKVGKHIGNIDKVYFGAPYCHQTLLCRKECFYSVRFDESFKITMWKFSLDLHLAGFKHVYLPETIAYFRVGGVSTNKSHEEKFRAEQSRIKKDHIANRLGLTMEEYEYFNHSIRRWCVAGLQGVDVEAAFAKLFENQEDWFSKEFFLALMRLISEPKVNKALPKTLHSIVNNYELLGG